MYRQREVAIKQLFVRGPSIATRLLLLALISIALMTTDHRFHHLDTVRSSLSVLVYPLQYVVNLPRAVVGWAGETFTTRQSLQEANSDLRTQNQLLKAQLQKFVAVETENQRLRQLLQSSRHVGERVLIAELLAVDMDPFSHRIVLNKGRNDEAYAGQPMVDAQGVMGQLVHVGPLTSTAMLITDPSHALPVEVNRNGLRAIAAGTGAPRELELEHIPNNADIRVGDLLVTSGLGGVFPPGYPVAHVTAVNIDPGQPFARVLAEPMAHLDRSREVLLVWPTQRESVPAPVADAGPGKP